MSEMEWEEAPQVRVPLVRPWLSGAVRSWHQGVYPPRHGFWFAWGWLLLFPLLWIALKAAIFWAGVLLLILAGAVWAVAECITYRHRVRRAALRAWAPYMGEILDGEPPPQAA